MLLHKQKSTCVRRYYPQFFQSRLTFFIAAVFSKQVEIHITGNLLYYWVYNQDFQPARFAYGRRRCS